MKLKNLAVYTVIALAVLYSVRVIIRGQDWADSKTLWLATAKVSETSAEVHNTLGYEYYQENRHDEAIKEYQRAIELKPYYSDPYHNMGTAYMAKGEMELAKTAFLKALELNPRSYFSVLNLSSIAYEQGDLALSKEYLLKTLAINPSLEIARSALQTVNQALETQQKVEINE